MSRKAGKAARLAGGRGAQRVLLATAATLLSAAAGGVLLFPAACQPEPGSLAEPVRPAEPARPVEPGQQARPGGHGEPVASPGVDYRLEIVDPGRHLVHVEASVRGWTGSTATIGLSSWFDADRTVKLDRLEARGPDERPLPVVPVGTGHVVSGISGGRFTFGYDLRMDQRGPQGPMGYLDDGYLLSSAAWTFAVPRDGPADLQYGVTFAPHAGWVVVCPWRREGARYVEHDRLRFEQASFALGSFVLREQPIQGTLVRLAVDSRFDEQTASALFKNGFAIFTFFKLLFQTPEPAEHLAIFARAGGPAQWQGFNESGSSHGVAAEDLRSALYAHAHRVFHVFNSFRPTGMTVASTWFEEGVDEYYGLRALVPLRFGTPLQGLAGRYDIYRKGRATHDMPLAGSTRQPGDPEKEHWLAYDKGALVAFLLDRAIRQASEGRGSLDDVLRILYRRHGQHRNGPVDDAVVLAAVNQVAGRDLTPLFDRWVRRATPLEPELAPLLADDDRDGISNAGEELLRTDPRAWDSDRDGASDRVEYLAATDPRSAASRPTLPLQVDGRSGDWRHVAATGGGRDPSGDSSCETDISTVTATRAGDALYLLLSTRCPVAADGGLRYYANLDLDRDGVADLQVAAVPGSGGDTSRFRQDWTNYGLRPMEEVPGLLSALDEAVEFRIPASLLQGSRSVQASCGVWDTRTGRALDSTGWIVLDRALER